MQDKASRPLIETLPMTLGTPYTDDPSTPQNIEIPLQVALPDGQLLYAAVALGGLHFHDQQQIAERIAAAWNAFAGVATSDISAPGQCLHQIQEPAAAEQAAWYAGLDEGRAQAAPAAVAVPWENFPAFLIDYCEGDVISEEGLQSALAAMLADPQYAALAATPAAPESAVQLHPSRAGRVYVAGPMTGLPDFNFPAFNAAAADLRAKGWHVENPAEHGIVDGAEWADYLHYDLGRLATCAAMYLLPGWSQSRGATLEVHVATALGMTLFYAEGAEIYRQPCAAAAPVVLPEPEAVISEVMGLVDEWGMESHLRGEAELDAQHSEATQEEIDCAKDRASKERAAWNAIESKLRALLAQAATAAAPAHPAEGVLAEPLLWVSPEQAKELDDRAAGDGGNYLPCRKTRDGLFTMPLYTAPADALATATGLSAQAVERGEVLVTVSGLTGSGKSAVAGEIEIMCRALGLQVEWPDGESEKNMTHADWTAALELYKPRVRIVERNVPASESKHDH